MIWIARDEKSRNFKYRLNIHSIGYIYLPSDGYYVGHNWRKVGQSRLCKGERPSKINKQYSSLPERRLNIFQLFFICFGRMKK